MSPRERERFDAILEEIIDDLPPALHELLAEKPLIVDDAPDPDLLREMGMDETDEDLCGLHQGVPLTERSVESEASVETMHLFREGIVRLAGGWRRRRTPEGELVGGEDAVRREIRITLLHEIGHHFGLEEDDLDHLGYG